MLNQRGFEKELRILVLGLIFKALPIKDISEVGTTLGFNIKNLQYEGFILNVWDFGGEGKLHQNWSYFFEDPCSLIFVIDSFDQMRLEKAGKELDTLLNKQELKKVHLILFANKQDLFQALLADEISDTLKLNKIIDRQWFIVACSAKTQEGLQEGMEWLIRRNGMAYQNINDK